MCSNTRAAPHRYSKERRTGRQLLLLIQEKMQDRVTHAHAGGHATGKIGRLAVIAAVFNHNPVIGQAVRRAELHFAAQFANAVHATVRDSPLTVAGPLRRARSSCGPSQSKLTMAYVHGWQPGTTKDLARETFDRSADSGIAQDLTTSCKQKGWDIGIYYWNQFLPTGDTWPGTNKLAHSYCRPLGRQTGCLL